MNATDHARYVAALRLLRAIDRLAGTDGDNGYPTAAEIADRLGDSASAVGGRLRRLEASGHVTKMGESFSGARTWAVTDAGHAVLQNGINR